MSNSNEESAALKQFLDIVLAYRPDIVGKFVFPAYWSFSSPGAGSGPMVPYDRKMQVIPANEWRNMPNGYECLDLFARILVDDPELIGSRKLLDDGFLANRLAMTIYPDRRVEMKWSFDAESDRVELEQIKKYLTPEEIADAEIELAEYVEYKGRSRALRRIFPRTKEEPSAPPVTSVPENQSWTIPELFQAIVNTSVGAAPDGWTKLVVDGQVGVETDASGRALNSVSADFQAQMADGSVCQINPQQPIAAMNALTLLQKQLPNLEGKPWRRLRVSFDKAVPEQVAYEFDQAGIWRPGSQ